MNIQYRNLFFILALLSETPPVLSLALPGFISPPVLASNSATASAKNIYTAASLAPKVGGRVLGPDTRAAIVFRQSSRTVAAPTGHGTADSLKVARVAIAGREEAGWEHAGLMEPSTARSDGWESAARVDLEQKSIVVPFDGETVRQGPVGACHSFAFTEMFFAATGLKLSKARAFLDHLLSTDKHGPDAVHKIFDVNTNHIDKLRGRPRSMITLDSCRNIPDLEGGWFRQDLELVQTVGGVVVPHNSDWNEVMDISERIQEERLHQARLVIPLSLDERKKRLADAGMSRLIEMTLATTDKAEADRAMIKEIAKKMSVEGIVLNWKSSIARAMDLIDAIEKKGAVYLSVNPQRYNKALLQGSSFSVEMETAGQFDQSPFPTRGGHTVTLVGYRVRDDVFLVKDSNYDHILEIDARNLASATADALVLVKQ